MPPPAFQLFPGEGVSIAQMFLKIEENRIFLAIVLFERRAQLADRAADVDPGVLLHGIELALPLAEQLEDEFPAVAAEAQRLAAEDLPAVDVEAVLAQIGAGEERADLGAERRGDRLVGLQDQDPLVAQRQMVEPPLEDPGDDPPVLV